MASRPRTRNQAVPNQEQPVSTTTGPATVTAAASGPKKAPKRKRSQTTAKPPAPEAESVDQLSATPTATSHPYETRPSNNPHPGKHVGIEKRRQADISLEAAAKKAERQAEVEARMQKQEERAQRERAGVAAVAALLDKQHTEGVDDEVASTSRPFEPPMLSVNSIPNTAGPTTAKEKRSQIAAQLWTDIRAARTTPTPVRSGTTSISITNSVATNKSLTAQSGINSNWHHKVATQGPGSDLSTLTGSSPIVRDSQVEREHQISRHATETIGGFSDAPVATQKPTLSKGYRTQMIAFEDRDLPQAVGPIIKKPRAARTDIQPEKSKALKHMPDWIRDELDETKGHIIPTVIEFYACQSDPWELDYEKADVFLWLVHTIIDHLFPEEHFRISSKSDQIYQKVRQGISNVRSKIAKTGLSYVKNKMGELTGPAQAREVARQAMHPETGELYWAIPEEGTKDLFKSPCVLVGVAEYLKATENSILSDLDLRHGPMQQLGLVCGLPEGALTMAICAAHRGFLAFEHTGKFEAPRSFSIAELKGNRFQLGIWDGHATSVRKNMMATHKHHRFDAILNAANEYLLQSHHDNRSMREEVGGMYIGGLAVIQIPSSPISYGPGEGFYDDDNE